jgi:hypothetical protein
VFVVTHHHSCSYDPISKEYFQRRESLLTTWPGHELGNRGPVMYVSARKEIEKLEFLDLPIVPDAKDRHLNRRVSPDSAIMIWML